jgi:PAS domain S-box-containing protein
MQSVATLPTAIAATALGLGLLGLVWLVLRLTGRSSAWTAARVPPPVTLPVEHGEAEAAVLWAEAGGRLKFVNDRARELFGLRGPLPTMWQLARKVQPAEAFEGLLVEEGRTRLTIGAQQVEATSLRVSAGLPAEFVLVLRQADAAQPVDLDLAEPGAHGTQALNVLTEINHAISANLDLSATLDAILSNLGRVFQYNSAEITLWDEDTQTLIPARRTGSRDYDRALARAGRTSYPLDQGFSGWLASNRTPLRVADVQSSTPVRLLFESPDFPVRSYLGAPLVVGSKLVGTVELLSLKVEAYRKGDELLIATIAGQAAIAIENAHRYADQQQRLAELRALGDISRAIESTADPRELYTRLTTEIARLMEAQIAGLLLWDSAQGMLVGQPPFHGMPDIVSVLYQILIPAGSALAERWQANQPWLCNQAQEDAAIDAIGLRQMVDAVGIRTSLLAPISVGGRRVGAVHICNKGTGQVAFTEADGRRLMIFAGQVAAILENSRLVGEAQSRAEQAEGLRNIAAALASSTNVDEVLATAMRQSAALFHFDVGVISILDEARGELAPRPASTYGVSSDQLQLLRLRAGDPDYALSVTARRLTLFIGSVYRDVLDTSAPPVSVHYRRVLDQFKLESAMAVPLVAGDRCLGEMLVGARREDTFRRTELQLLSTVAAQLASGMERVRLYAATDQDLQRRVDQLTALTRVSREINQTLVLENLLRLVGDEARRVTRADCGTLVLLAKDGRPEAEIRVGDEELGNPLTAAELELMMAAGPAGDPARSEPLRLTDLSAASPLAAHPGVRSALIVPIVAGGMLAGFIHLHSRQPAGFDAAAEEIVGALAAQTAIAVTNAQRLDEQEKRNLLLSRRAEQLEQLLQISRTVRSDLPLATNLETIAASIWEAVGFNVVLIGVLDPQTRMLNRTVCVGLPLETGARLQQIDVPWAGLAGLLQDEFCVGHAYYVPKDRAQAVEHADLLPVSGGSAPVVFDNAWQPGDLFLVPLTGVKESVVGLLALDSPLDGARPDRTTAEIVEIFANQAALAIEDARLYQAAERRAARLMALHRIHERAGRGDRHQIWQTMAEAMVDELALDVALVALVDFAAAPREARPAPLAIQGKAGNVRAEIDFAPMMATASAAMETGDAAAAGAAGGGALPFSSLLVSDVANSTVWAGHPLILATQVTSFAAAPIVSQGQLAGMLFAGAQGSGSPILPEDLDLFSTLAGQLGASFESMRLEVEALAERGERAALMTALAEVSRVITAALRPDDVVNTIMENLHKVIAYDSVTLWLRSERNKAATLRVAAVRGFENAAERLGLTVDVADSALFAEMARTGGAIWVRDVRDDARFPGAVFLPTRSWLGVPLISKGQIVGALAVDKAEINAYSAQAAHGLMSFANQAAIALENARLFEESQQRNAEFNERSQRLALLNRISIQLSSTLDERRLSEVALTEVALALNVSQAALVAFDEDGKTRVAGQIPVYRPLPEGYDRNPAILHVYETQRPVVIEDVSQDLLLTETRAIFAARDVKSLLVIPLVVAGTPVAAVQLEETTPRRFTPAEIELAQTLANQAAVAVQNARLYNDTQARLAELATLNRLSNALASTINLEQICATVSEQVRPVMGVDCIYLALYDEARNSVSFPLMVEAGQRLEVAPCPPGGLTGHIIRSRQPLLLRGSWPAVQAELQARGALQIGAGAAHSYLGVPLIIGERVTGVLAVQDLVRTDVFTTVHERLLRIIAAQVAVTVENARFAQELEERVASRTHDVERARVRLETLLKITTELSASLDLELVLARTLELVTSAVRAPQGSIYLIDDENPNQLIYRAALGRPVPLRPGGEPSPFKANEGLIGWVIAHRQGLISGNVDTDPRWVQRPQRATSARSALAVPLMAGEEVLGGMILLSGQPDAFDEEQLRLVAPAANLVGSAINNAKLYRMIENLNRETGQALREQMVEASKSRAILEGIADGVMVTDDRGGVILYNAACERILGLERSQVVGQPATNFVGIYGASGRAWLDAMTQWSENPESYETGKFFSERVTLDQKRIISVHLSPLTTGREYLGSVSVIRDISHEVEVDRLKSEFVTNVSHELRTPMAAIKGYADILLMGAGGPVAPQQVKFLQVIKGNADRLGILVNDLLDISRLESDQVDLVRQPVDIGEVIRGVARVLERRTIQQSKPMKVTTDIPAGLPPVLGDRERVTQILQALADNAFNYSAAGESVRLVVRHEGDANQIRIEVSDTGIGITPEEQKRLFSRFYRGENPLVLKTPGNGLGLAIAQQLAERHGGRIWLVASQTGQGSTFAVSLPAA